MKTPESLYLERLKSPLGGEVFALPVFPGRVEFADAVRRAFFAVKPTALAVELPETLGDAFKRAVSRLPRITVLTYAVKGGRGYLVVEPGDPFCEAARLALEKSLPLHFVDADQDELPDFPHSVPDPHVSTMLGHRAYMESLLKGLPPASGLKALQRQKTVAALSGAKAMRGVRLLLAVSPFTLPGLGKYIGEAGALPFRSVKKRSPELFHLAASSLGEALTEIAFVQAAYELSRGQAPAPRRGTGLTVRKKLGVLELLKGEAPWDEERALDESVREAAARNGAPETPFDRFRALYHLIQEAGRHYAQETGEELLGWQKRALFKFLRNWALTEGRLLPDLFQLVEGAKAVVDDNFAYSVWRLAARTPWQGSSDDLPVAELSAEELGYGSRRVRMRRRNPKAKARPIRLKRGGAKGVDPKRWLQGFTGEGLCSYPPEDVVVEKFGGWLKARAVNVYSEESARSEPFSGSLLDGIDMRETIRHLPSKKVYVKKFGKLKGGMGSVVVIFDEAPAAGEYPFSMTWLGEHDQESDMAFYATDPAENIVGPGISRVLYGGFMLSYPPRRLYDVWHDADYAHLNTPAEKLLAAAIDYSLETNVVFCSLKPPSAYMKQYASRRGRRIIFVPMGSLGHAAKRKIRVMHMLDGRKAREIAKDYIW